MNNTNDQITFDETELNYLVEAVRYQISHTKWNVTDSDEWLILKSLKELEDKLYRTLDAAFDERQ